MSPQQWINVSSNTPCPICGRADWCTLSSDGTWALCRREARPDGKHGVDSSGVDYWIYSLTSGGEGVIYPSYQIPASQKKLSERADSKTLNEVYRALLNSLSLYSDHFQNLIDRGLDQNEIERRGYKTWPQRGRARICKELTKQFGEAVLLTVPGFYIKTDEKDSAKSDSAKPSKWLSFTGSAGLAIPVRDAQREIIALRLRPDEPGKAGKYRWLSSSYHDGPTPGAPIHIPGFDGELCNRDTLRVTEGELKADISTVLSGILTISLPGVASWRQAIELIKRLSPKVVRLAFDADVKSNPHVAQALKEFAEALIHNNISVELESWPEHLGKGIDDVLAAGHSASIEIISGEAVLAKAKEFVESSRSANPAPHEISLAKALKQIDIENFADSLKSESFLDCRENIQALALIQKYSIGIFVNKIKPILRKHGIVTDVNNLIKNCPIPMSYGGALPKVSGDDPGFNSYSGYNNNIVNFPNNSPNNSSNDPNSRQRTTLKSIFQNAPASNEVVIPDGWNVNSGGIWRVSAQKLPEHVSSCPVIVDKRLIDVNTGLTFLSLRWLSNNIWKEVIAPRSACMTARKIVELSDQDFPVNSNTAMQLTKWLADFEATNLAIIPTTKVSNQLGWQEKNSCFLLGADLIGSTEKSEDIKFKGCDTGDDKISSGFTTKGTLESWIEAVKPIAKYPRVLIQLYASFAAPLLSIINAPNFIMDSSGVTSRGKTVALRVAASVWGNPDERAAGTLIHGWNNTATYLERLSTTLCNLPVIMDDTKQVKFPKSLSGILYMFASGQGKGRGSRAGISNNGHWNTILLSTGEQPITSFSQDGGTRARVLSIWSPKGPFEDISQETGLIVNKLNAAMYENYGVAGRKFIKWLIENRNMWGDFKAGYHDSKKSYAERATNNPLAIRLTDYFAVLDLAAGLAHAALKLPWSYTDTVATLWDILTEESQKDLADEALAFIVSYAQSNEHTFYGRHEKYSTNFNTKIPPGGWSGEWVEGDWQALNFYPNVLQGILESRNFDWDSIRRIWRDRGILDVDNTEKRFTKKIRFNRGSARLISFKRESIETILGEFDSGDNNDY